ncbi:hydrogenase formation protein HypD [bacterium]|nr:hydrogenase formation protein HypD [bacterium]
MFKEIKENLRHWAKQIDRPLKLMEVCGTHTMAAFRAGLRSFLPENVNLLSGPGCPVCVTAGDYIDHVIRLTAEPNVMIATFGDMLRVPGNLGSLEIARAQGADILVVYSPVDAVLAAEKYSDKQVVFLGVGFETTAPTVAWTIQAAAEKKLANYSVFCAHKTMPQAMAALLQSKEVRIDGFVCPGHVSVITGTKLYTFIAEEYKTPCVVAGFEPLDIFQAITMLVQQCAEGRSEVENQYQRSVKEKGNQAAQALLAEIFEPCDAKWRGLGVISGSGLQIRAKYADYAAENKFAFLQEKLAAPEPIGCRCGEILRGVCIPFECPLFQKACTPANPIGACMVSNEGTCAAYYKYAQKQRKV